MSIEERFNELSETFESLFERRLKEVDEKFLSGYDESRPTARTYTLLQAARYATNNDNWQNIASYLRSDFRAFGPPGPTSFERFFFQNCPLSILCEISDELAENAIGFLKDGNLRVAFRVIHLVFSSLLAIYNRDRKEINRLAINEFILVVEQETLSLRIAFPSDIHLRFEVFRFGMPDSIPEPRNGNGTH